MPAELELHLKRARPLPEWLGGATEESTAIIKLLEIIGFGSKCVVDVGVAGDGWYDGCLVPLVCQLGFRGFFAEQIDYRVDRVISACHGHDAIVKKLNLNIAEQKAGLEPAIQKHFDQQPVQVLSLRLRGPEWQVWNDLNIRPICMAITFNPTFPSNVEYVQPDGPEIYKGASLLSLVQLGKNKGYELVFVGKFQAFFVQRELLPLFNMEDNSIEALWDGGDWQSRVVQCYDGTLMLAGNHRLLWNRLGTNFIELKLEDLQVIPQEFRKVV